MASAVYAGKHALVVMKPALAEGDGRCVRDTWITHTAPRICLQFIYFMEMEV